MCDLVLFVCFRCDGKEHLFTAENHESMMIWLMGMQAKRDAYAKRTVQAVLRKTTTPDTRSMDARSMDTRSMDARSMDYLDEPTQVEDYHVYYYVQVVAGSNRTEQDRAGQSRTELVEGVWSRNELGRAG